MTTGIAFLMRRRPAMLRRIGLAAALLAVTGLAVPAPAAARLIMRPSHAVAAARAESFKAFLRGLWPDAHARGISAATFDAAFLGVEPDPSVLARTRVQAEFHKSLGDYLALAVSGKRIATGREKYKAWAGWLAKAEQRFGVDRYVILGVWGLETNYGTKMGDDYVMRSLATLAAAHYRGNYFRTELLKALQILEDRQIDPQHMLGSWAGAMGQTQFMPSSFDPYAVDFDGAGKRDIWTSVPDALGSTANFLKKHGWIRGETWGYEVVPPAGVEPVTGRYLGFADWADRGYQRADGGDMPRSGKAMLLRPAGAGGPSFLVTPNFRVIKSYNNSTAYALGVALLGDRVAGWGPLRTPWPVAAR